MQPSIQKNLYTRRLKTEISNTQGPFLLCHTVLSSLLSHVFPRCSWTLAWLLEQSGISSSSSSLQLGCQLLLCRQQTTGSEGRHCIQAIILRRGIQTINNLVICDALHRNPTGEEGQQIRDPAVLTELEQKQSYELFGNRFYDPYAQI